MTCARMLFIVLAALMLAVGGCAHKVYQVWPFDAQDAVRRQSETAGAFGIPRELTLHLGNKVRMNLVLIPAGRFLMGSPEGEACMVYDDDRQHEVVITKPFYISATEVTKEQWKAVMGTMPWMGQFRGRGNSLDKDDASFFLPETASATPAVHLSWEDAVEFCNNLSRQCRRKVVLPTEAQWEYACRAGSKARFSYGEDNDDFTALNEYAWYIRNSGVRPHQVGQKKPNTWGAYDMMGNVWEWCADWNRIRGPFAIAGQTDPQGPPIGEYRVLRGGSCYNGAIYCRSAAHAGNRPDHGAFDVGFRVIVAIK